MKKIIKRSKKPKEGGEQGEGQQQSRVLAIFALWFN